MNGSIVFYPEGDAEPKTAMTGSTGVLDLENRAYAPTLLIHGGDQAYLRRLAKAAADLADLMDAPPI